MTAPRSSGEKTRALVRTLADKDGLVRQRARRALVALGRPAVGQLVDALSDPRERVRWEAAKAMTEISDASAAPALMAALEDQESGICWLAAEALIALGRDALMPLLQALVVRSGSARLRGAAHHILKAQRGTDLRSVLTPVMAALEHFDPEEFVPVAAEEALEALRKRSRSTQRRT